MVYNSFLFLVSVSVSGQVFNMSVFCVLKKKEQIRTRLERLASSLFVELIQDHAAILDIFLFHN